MVPTAVTVTAVYSRPFVPAGIRHNSSYMPEDGRDKQRSWLCYAASSLLLEIHAASPDTLHSGLATHVTEREKMT